MQVTTSHEFSVPCCRSHDGLWLERERIVTQDEPLCDGTPRRERGYRARVMMHHTDRAYRPGLPHRAKVLRVSPLFPSKATAEAWVPDMGGR